MIMRKFGFLVISIFVVLLFTSCMDLLPTFDPLQTAKNLLNAIKNLEEVNEENVSTICYIKDQLTEEEMQGLVNYCQDFHSILNDYETVVLGVSEVPEAKLIILPDKPAWVQKVYVINLLIKNFEIDFYTGDVSIDLSMIIVENKAYIFAVYKSEEGNIVLYPVLIPFPFS